MGLAEKLLTIGTNFTLILFIFLAGLLAGLVLFPLPTKWASKIAVHLPWKCVSVGRFLFRGITWSLYRSASNAVVLKSIGDCVPYLALHFAMGKPGEIWLYNNDLTAFADDGLFSDLYKKMVFPMTNIHTVKIVFDKRCQEKLNSVSKEVWRSIRNRLIDSNEHGKRARIIKYMFTDDSLAAICDAEFTNFVSEEAYVFYTGGPSLHGSDSICVYRRYDGDMHAADEDRVILLAKRNGKHFDPLSIFMPEAIVNTFTKIFVHTERTKWDDLLNLAELRAT